MRKAATCAWLFALLKGQVCAEGVHTAPCKNWKGRRKAAFFLMHTLHFVKTQLFLPCFLCDMIYYN